VRKVTIAIDGYSSCGKSTLAKEIAKNLNYRYVDSGAMYRAVTLYLINKGILKDGNYLKKAVLDALPFINIDFIFNKDKGISETFLNSNNVEKDIRTMFISKQVSPISAIEEVRTKLVDLQQQMGTKGAVVMDGRDIGTVVFPDAEIKLFMTADPDIRAERRLLELDQTGQKSTFDEVKDNLTKRDYIDMNRDVSPLRQAKDAIVIDNSEITREEQLEVALNIIKEKINK
jgi:cytidylate kinase